MDFSLSDVIIAVLSIITAAFGFIIREQREKIKSIKNQLSERKYNLYHEVFSIFFDLLKDQKGIIENNQKDLGIRIIDVKKDMLIYAPDIINQTFIKWNHYVSNNPGDIRHINIYLDLFILIRKDMGNPKTKTTHDDIWKTIMTTDEEIQKMKTLLSK